MIHKQTGTVRSSLITVGVIVFLLLIAYSMLPKGYSNDLSLIGKGSNVAVLAHNKGSVQSLNLMDLVNKVRGEYANKVTFVVVDTDSPNGRVFMQQQQLNQTGILLFAPDGKRLGVFSSIKNESDVRTALNNTYHISSQPSSSQQSSSQPY